MNLVHSIFTLLWYIAVLQVIVAKNIPKKNQQKFKSSAKLRRFASQDQDGIYNGPYYFSKFKTMTTSITTTTAKAAAASELPTAITTSSIATTFSPATTNALPPIIINLIVEGRLPIDSEIYSYPDCKCNLPDVENIDDADFSNILDDDDYADSEFGYSANDDDYELRSFQNFSESMFPARVRPSSLMSRCQRDRQKLRRLEQQHRRRLESIREQQSKNRLHELKRENTGRSVGEQKNVRWSKKDNRRRFWNLGRRRGGVQSTEL